MPSTIRGLLGIAIGKLHGEDRANEASILLGHVTGLSRAGLVVHADDAVDDAQRAAFEALVKRRAGGEPAAYLVGRRGFHTIDLVVTPDVLIPRAETELLVDVALRRIPVDAGCTVADLGTGSGAVALAIAHARPRASIVATDASVAALEVARENAIRLGLPDVVFTLGDWCDPLGGTHFDVIVSNPPYVREGDPHLDGGDLRFEPRAALVAGADGLDAIRSIVRDACSCLRDGGWLLLEHGCEQGDAVRGLLARRGYVKVLTERDLEGRERVSGGRWRQASASA